MPFDIRQPVPLMIVAAFHVLVLSLFHSGLHRSAFTPPEPRKVSGFLIQPRIEQAADISRPEPVPAQPEPLKPKPLQPETPKPQPPQLQPKPETPKPPKSKPLPKPAPKPKPATAMGKPSEPAVPAQTHSRESTSKPPAYESVPAPVAAAPAPPSPPAPPAPVAAPRFDAAYLNNPAPKYPPLSRRMGEEGKVVLRVQVSPGGQAAEVELHASSGSARLDEAAQDAVRSWRFVPATQGEKAVSAWVLVPVSFRLDG